jgi:N-acetyl-gamma-glutamyl-phosphate reductase
MKISVIGASGFTGGELLSFIDHHPDFHLHHIAAGNNSGELITDLHPQLTGFDNKKFESIQIGKINESDLVFIALPHGESSKLIHKINTNVKIVDLGADYRLKDGQQWRKYYPGEYAGHWTYGLPELVDHAIIATSLRVANPGCYATAISLAIAPALDFIDINDIVIVASSGTSGAGRNAKVNLHNSKFENNLSSYKFGGVHQHIPEIEQTLAQIAAAPVKISFTPVLAPITRGILATVTAKVLKNITPENMRSIFIEFYKNSQFIQILAQSELPDTLSVLGTNNVKIQLAFDSHVNRLIVSSSLDNLTKGAATQAIQNANLMSGLPEHLGLVRTGLK